MSERLAAGYGGRSPVAAGPEQVLQFLRIALQLRLDEGSGRRRHRREPDWTLDTATQHEEQPGSAQELNEKTEVPPTQRVGDQSRKPEHRERTIFRRLIHGTGRHADPLLVDAQKSADPSHHILWPILDVGKTDEVDPFPADRLNEGPKLPGILAELQVLVAGLTDSGIEGFAPSPARTTPVATVHQEMRIGAVHWIPERDNEPRAGAIEDDVS